MISSNNLISIKSEMSLCDSEENKNVVYGIKITGMKDEIMIKGNDKILAVKRKDAICSKMPGLCRIGSKNMCKLKNGEYCYRKSESYEASWVLGSDIDERDFVAHSINNSNKNSEMFSNYFDFEPYWYIENKDIITFDGRKRRKIFRDFIVDRDFMELCGWYVSEGCCTKRLIRFTLNENETEFSERIMYCIRKLGRHCKIYKKGDHSQDIAVTSVVLAKFFKDNFGSKAKDKRIPKWILDLDTKLLKYFLKGVFLGDGCESHYSLVYASASESLIMGLFEILLKFGCFSRLRNYFTRGITNIRDSNGHRLVMNDKMHPMYKLDCTLSQNNKLFKFIGFNTKIVSIFPKIKCLIDNNYVFMAVAKKYPIDMPHQIG